MTWQGGFTNPTVGPGQILPGSVGQTELADGSVITAKLADLAVEAGKLANLAVTTGKIGDGAITTVKIDDLAVTQAKIGLLAVGTAQIADAAITNAKIDTLSADKITSGTINTGTIDIESLLTVATTGELRVNGDSGQSTRIKYSGGFGGIEFWGTGSDDPGYMYAINSEELQIAAPVDNASTHDWGMVRLTSENTLGFVAGVLLGTNNNASLLSVQDARVRANVDIHAVGGAKALQLYAGASDDHTYMEFYADSSSQSTRSGYFGFSSGGTDIITLANELGGGLMQLDHNGLVLTGTNPYTTAQAWLTLHSDNAGGAYDDQEAGISIGESGLKGSAAGHIVYTGDGYLHIGAGTVTNGANPPMAYPVFKIHYNGNRVQHMSGAEAPGWDRYSNSAPGSVRLEAVGLNYRVYQHTSSARFKSNIKAIPTKWAWDFINLLEPITYKGATTKDYYAGLTAENVYAAEQLIKKRSKASFVALDGEGEPDSYGDEGITAMLIKTIQDLNERLTVLEAA